MNTAIIGAGAVGLGIGSGLLASGNRVCFVVRGDAEPARLERSGIFGNVSFPADAFEVRSGVSSLKGTDLDFVLVCTKTFACEVVARELGRIWDRFPKPPSVVLAQNGWGSADRFVDHIPRAHIFNARVITGFRRIAPFQVDVTVHADAIRMGSLFGTPVDGLRPLADRIQDGGVPCEVSEEIAKDLWAKLLYNCALNPLGALCGVPYGRLGEVEAYRRIMDSAVHEVFSVMEAAGYSTHWPDAKDYLAEFYGELLPTTARHESSMLQDIRGGRATEIDALSGAVAELGNAHGVQTPVNAALRDLVRAASSRTQTSSEPLRVDS